MAAVFDTAAGNPAAAPNAGYVPLAVTAALTGVVRRVLRLLLQAGREGSGPLALILLEGDAAAALTLGSVQLCDNRLVPLASGLGPVALDGDGYATSYDDDGNGGRSLAGQRHARTIAPRPPLNEQSAVSPRCSTTRLLGVRVNPQVRSDSGSVHTSYPNEVP